MKEAFENAVQELKRVDHLFWVSLKYTRTVDVIKNTVERLINVFDFGLNSILICSKEKKIIKNFHNNPGLKCDLLKETFPDNKELLDHIALYLKLRRIMNSHYAKKEEYRRHVTMIVNVDGETINVDIDLIKVYYDTAKKFIHLVQDMTKEET